MNYRAAILAIGTEVTEGQIVDRNSASISQRLVKLGIQIVEHRSVADDRAAISLALSELSERCELLFVTGGLGPTSDDFTREVLSEHFQLPLKFDLSSWNWIEERFRDRGLVARPIQRQQCFFPEGAEILHNPSGTANAFCFYALASSGKKVRVYALPGPPIEIASVWSLHIESQLEMLVPAEQRMVLSIYRTLGVGESQVAELIEPLVLGTGLQVGYRAHVPYVELKLWCRAGERQGFSSVFNAIEGVLKSKLVSRDETDLVDGIVTRFAAGQTIVIHDAVSEGYLHERVINRCKEKKLFESTFRAKGKLDIHSVVEAANESSIAYQDETSSPADIFISFHKDGEGAQWILNLSWLSLSGHQSKKIVVAPTALYKPGTERGNKYAVEMALFEISRRLGDN